MTWPQVVIVVLLALQFLVGAVRHFRNSALTSWRVVAALFVDAVIYAAYAFVLHAGGFW